MHDLHEQPNAATSRPRRMRRGTIYVLVLGAALVLLAIGLSAISLSRASAYNTNQSNDWLDSQLLAFTATEHALAKINADDNWRTTYNGVTVTKSIGGKSFTWRVVDEVDGDLTNNTTDPAVLLVTAAAGKASYAMRINLDTAASAGSAAPTLWGVGWSDGTLFSTGNYNRIVSTTTLYGLLKWNDAGTIKNVGNHIQGMVLTSGGDAYMVRNENIGSYGTPVLLKFNVNTASTTANNVVTIIGSIPWSKDITGLAIAPDTGDLYALGLVGDDNAADRLLILNKTTGAISQNVGAITGAGYTVGKGSGMAFDDQGNLYVAEAKLRALYRVNKATGAILAVVDAQTTSSGQINALAYDPLGKKILGVDSSSNLYWITPGDGGNTLLGYFTYAGLNTVEAIGFIPGTTGGPKVRPALTGSSIKRTVQ